MNKDVQICQCHVCACSEHIAKMHTFHFWNVRVPLGTSGWYGSIINLTFSSSALFGDTISMRTLFLVRDSCKILFAVIINVIMTHHCQITFHETFTCNIDTSVKHSI